MAIHITSKRSLKPPTSGLFVLGPNPDDNGVLLSSEGTRFNIEIAWHRGERDGRLGTTGDAGICSALNREQHRGTAPTPWDWNDWRSTLQKIADMPSLWILAKQVARRRRSRWDVAGASLTIDLPRGAKIDPTP